MVRTALLLLMALCGTAPAFATKLATVSIRTDETITIRSIGDELVIVERVRAEPLSSFDKWVAQTLVAETPPPSAGALPPIPRYGTPVPAPLIRPQEIRMTFRHVLGKSPSDTHTLLLIQNGYSRSFLFRAMVFSGSKSAATDVCEVLAGKHGVEHWPYKIDRLDLTALRLEAEREGYVRCE